MSDEQTSDNPEAQPQVESVTDADRANTKLRDTPLPSKTGSPTNDADRPNTPGENGDPDTIKPRPDRSNTTDEPPNPNNDTTPDGVPTPPTAATTTLTT